MFPNWATAREALKQKQISVSELISHYSQASQAEKLGAVLTHCTDRAVELGKKAEGILKKEGGAAFDRYPLLGAPIAIKDVLSLKGVRTTCGSKILENYISPYTATCVSRLEQAGAVVLGKTNCDEFAMGGSNENSAYGPVQHPTHQGYVPGGSSGGSAASVKAGLCLAALGSDTGGSIRLPASYCGIVGMKPTYGTVSRYGLVAFASSLDQVGPMTQTVADAALFLEVMSGHDPMDSTSIQKPSQKFSQAIKNPLSFKGIKVGVPKEYFISGVAPEVEQAIQSSLKWFERQGAKLVPISLPHTSLAVAVYYLVAVSEASSNLSRFDGVRYGSRPPGVEQSSTLDEFYEKVRTLFGSEVKRRILLGTFALSSGYYDAYYRRACQVRRLIKNDFDSAFQNVDFIAAPVSPTTAFKLAEKSKDPLQMYLNDIFTIPVSLAGIPAMSIPCGEDQQGLPIGLQIIGAAFQDEQVLKAAHAFEMGKA